MEVSHDVQGCRPLLETKLATSLDLSDTAGAVAEDERQHGQGRGTKEDAHEGLDVGVDGVARSTGARVVYRRLQSRSSRDNGREEEADSGDREEHVERADATGKEERAEGEEDLKKPLPKALAIHPAEKLPSSPTHGVRGQIAMREWPRQPPRASAERGEKLSLQITAAARRRYFNTTGTRRGW